MSKSLLSTRVSNLKPSGIRKFFDIAATMENVISLGIGEPDFDSPSSRYRSRYSCLAGRIYTLHVQRRNYRVTRKINSAFEYSLWCAI